MTADRLGRFLRAQEQDHATALAELAAGRMRSHWIWYVLPQLRGLGRSAMAWEYGLAGRAEAAAYAMHPVLGPRLVVCVEAVLRHPERTAVEMLGEVDGVKFRSCLTLFARVHPAEPCFHRALDTFYDGVEDAETVRLLEADRP